MVERRICEDEMKHLNPQVKPSLRPQFVAFAMIAFLLVPHELIHGVSDRGMFAPRARGNRSKVILTFIGPFHFIAAP